MELANDHEVAINLKLFKQFCFDHIIFDLKSSINARLNVYRLSFIISTAVVLCLLIFGYSGFIIKIDDPPDFIDRFVVFYGMVYYFSLLSKLYWILNNSKKQRDIFDVTRLDFLRSNQCRKHTKILHKHRKKSIKISNLYCIFSIVVIIQWILFPLIGEKFISHNIENQRIQNILNFPFPVTVSTYNHYFYVFYTFEITIAMYLMYGLIMLDMYILSYGWTIITQYKILSMAFQYIGNEDEHQTETNDIKDVYNEFKSTLQDLVRLDRKVKMYYSIARPIVYIHIALNSFLFIVMAFILITVYMSSESIPWPQILLFSSSLLYIGFQIALYCYLFDHMNTERESINFGIYSCNWTEMDIEFQKLVLLSMRMNDANQLILKLTPKKIINMQLFFTVMMTSYNIISVMVKTIGVKK